MNSPNFCDQVINIIPGDCAVCDTSPPAHAIRREDIAMSMEVVSYGYFVVFPGRSDESNPECFVCGESARRII